MKAAWIAISASVFFYSISFLARSLSATALSTGAAIGLHFFATNPVIETTKIFLISHLPFVVKQPFEWDDALASPWSTAMAIRCGARACRYSSGYWHASKNFLKWFSPKPRSGDEPGCRVGVGRLSSRLMAHTPSRANLQALSRVSCVGLSRACSASLLASLDPQGVHWGDRGGAICRYYCCNKRANRQCACGHPQR